MKRVILALLTLASSTRADLIAHVETDKGTIDVVMQYDKAPQAVANFITLSQATRTSIDPDTGAVRSFPYYVGEKFFRVLDSPSFKIAQTGSGTGTNSGGPGFTFKDEFDPTLTHIPYVLSMANSGPNTNGSQIFFTGSVPVSHLDKVHTIFGLIPDAASRAVIDALLASGDNNSSITAVSFDRTDPAAEAFDEFAQDLPTVITPPGQLVVVPGESSQFNLDPPATTGDIVTASRSTDLFTWQNEVTKHVGISSGPDVTPALTSIELDDASTPSAFYNLALAQHSDSVAPSGLSNRTLVLDNPINNHIHTYVFDSEGTGGDFSIQVIDGIKVDGEFVIDYFSSQAHSFLFQARTSITFGGTSFNPTVKCGWDSATDSIVTGRHSTSALGRSTFDKGPCTITR